MEALVFCRDVKKIVTILQDMNPFLMVAEDDWPDVIMATFDYQGTPTLPTLCCYIHHVPNMDSPITEKLLTFSLQEYERGQVHPNFDNVFRDAGDHRSQFFTFCAKHGPSTSQQGASLIIALPSPT